jgi:hypothetical protein
VFLLRSRRLLWLTCSSFRSRPHQSRSSIPPRPNHRHNDSAQQCQCTSRRPSWPPCWSLSWLLLPPVTFTPATSRGTHSPRACHGSGSKMTVASRVLVQLSGASGTHGSLCSKVMRRYVPPRLVERITDFVAVLKERPPVCSPQHHYRP